MTDPTEEDLLTAVRDSLNRDGRLGHIKAELRAAVMSILDQNPIRKPESPVMPEETRLINDLLREYLVWNGFVYSEQILVAETDLNKERATRESIATRLGVMDDARTSKIPLLFYIVSAFQSNIEEA